MWPYGLMDGPCVDHGDRASVDHVEKSTQGKGSATDPTGARQMGHSGYLTGSYRPELPAELPGYPNHQKKGTINEKADRLHWRTQ